MLRLAPIPSDESVVGLIPRHGRDKAARFVLRCSTRVVISAVDPVVAIGQESCGDTRVVRATPVQGVVIVKSGKKKSKCTTSQNPAWGCEDIGSSSIIQLKKFKSFLAKYIRSNL